MSTKMDIDYQPLPQRECDDNDQQQQQQRHHTNSIIKDNDEDIEDDIENQRYNVGSSRSSPSLSPISNHHHVKYSPYNVTITKTLVKIGKLRCSTQIPLCRGGSSILVCLLLLLTMLYLLSTIPQYAWWKQQSTNRWSPQLPPPSYYNPSLLYHSDEKETNLTQWLPHRIQLNDSETLHLVETESNLAAEYYQQWSTMDQSKHKNVKYSNVVYCDQVTLLSPYQVKQRNLYWQYLRAPASTSSTQTKSATEDMLDIYLYNAYYDNRLYMKPVVKILTVTDKQVPVEKRAWWCLLWFDEQKSPILTKVTDTYTIWPEYWGFGVQNGTFGPQLITCEIPNEYRDNNRIPRAVSLQPYGDCVHLPASPSNILRVIYNRRRNNRYTDSNIGSTVRGSENHRPSKPSIGICVQAFRFRTYDVSVRLVEWLEMVRLMGGDKVYFYVYGTTPNMTKVLRHYTREGFVTWRRLTLPGEQVNVESLYNYYYSKIGAKFWPQELLELNDCLYRNLYRHDYIALFDIDEMIMPQKRLMNWHQLINKIESGLTANELKHKAYYVNRHSYVYEMFDETTMPSSYFLPSTSSSSPVSSVEIPEYLYMMRHTYRAELKGAGENIKCFHRTSLVSALHNHFPMRCLNTTGHHSCNGLTIDPSDSILMHYRRNRSPPENCNSTVVRDCTIHDRTAWKYFLPLYTRTRAQLTEIFVNQLNN